MNSISSYISGDHGLFIVGIVVTTLGTLCLSYGYLNNAAIKLFIRSISYGLVFAAIGCDLQELLTFRASLCFTH